MSTILLNWDFVQKVIQLIIGLLPQILKLLKDIENENEN